MSRPEELRERTKQFALRIITLVRSLPKSDEGGILGKQVLRSGTSVAPNYRAIWQARSKADFYRKDGNRYRRGGRDSSLAGTFD